MTPNDIEQALKPVAEVLEIMGVVYFVGGSVASSLYGVARSTLDIDMVSNLKLEHVPQLVSALKDNYYVSEDLIVDAIHDSSSFNLIHLDTGVKIDVFITKNRPYDQAVSRRVREDTLSEEKDAAKFFLASPEDIVLAKLEWFKAGNEISERQWNDILGVLRVQDTNIDLEYLRLWAERLELSELLERALATK